MLTTICLLISLFLSSLNRKSNVTQSDASSSSPKGFVWMEKIWCTLIYFPQSVDEHFFQFFRRRKYCNHVSVRPYRRVWTVRENFRFLSHPLTPINIKNETFFLLPDEQTIQHVLENLLEDKLMFRENRQDFFLTYRWLCLMSNLMCRGELMSVDWSYKNWLKFFPLRACRQAALKEIQWA